MTKLLEKAYERIAQLPEQEQDNIATLILDELDSEDQWSDKFTASASVLEKLAQKALEEHRAGKTLPLDPDML